MSHCDHQFQNVTPDTNVDWIAYTFVCPFCGQIREVSKKDGEIKIIVKGVESPRP